MQRLESIESKIDEYFDPQMVKHLKQHERVAGSSSRLALRGDESSAIKGAADLINKISLMSPFIASLGSLELLLAPFLPVSQMEKIKKMTAKIHDISLHELQDVLLSTVKENSQLVAVSKSISQKTGVSEETSVSKVGSAVVKVAKKLDQMERGAETTETGEEKANQILALRHSLAKNPLLSLALGPMRDTYELKKNESQTVALVKNLMNCLYRLQQIHSDNYSLLDFPRLRFVSNAVKTLLILYRLDKIKREAAHFLKKEMELLFIDLIKFFSSLLVKMAELEARLGLKEGLLQGRIRPIIDELFDIYTRSFPQGTFSVLHLHYHTDREIFNVYTRIYNEDQQKKQEYRENKNIQTAYEKAMDIFNKNHGKRLREISTPDLEIMVKTILSIPSNNNDEDKRALSAALKRRASGETSPDDDIIISKCPHLEQQMCSIVAELKNTRVQDHSLTSLGILDQRMQNMRKDDREKMAQIQRMEMNNLLTGVMLSLLQEQRDKLREERRSSWFANKKLKKDKIEQLLQPLMNRISKLTNFEEAKRFFEGGEFDVLTSNLRLCEGRTGKAVHAVRHAFNSHYKARIDLTRSKGQRIADENIFFQNLKKQLIGMLLVERNRLQARPRQKMYAAPSLSSTGLITSSMYCNNEHARNVLEKTIHTMGTSKNMKELELSLKDPGVSGNVGRVLSLAKTQFDHLFKKHRQLYSDPHEPAEQSVLKPLICG